MLKRVKTALIALHLYLGLALCLVFVTWFASGLAMVYYRTPVLTDAQRLAFSERLSASAAAAALSVAAVPSLRADWSRIDSLRFGQLLARPVYRWQLADGERHNAWADDATSPALGPGLLRGEAQRWFGVSAQVRYSGSVDAATQWSFFSDVRTHLPLHRFTSGGYWRRDVYFSSRTGEPVVATTPGTRLLYYLGPGLHYLSFYPIRNRDPLWRALVNWSAGIGALLCLTGAIVGLWRLRWNARGTSRRMIPHADRWMRWHHWSGLAFGGLALSFVLSGLFSMNPAGMFPETSVPAALQQAYRGPRPALSSLPAPAELLRSSSAKVREIDYSWVRGVPYAVTVGTPDERQLIARQGERWNPRPPFTERETLAQLGGLIAAPVSRVETLTGFDEQYYARKQRHRPLPALRVRLADADATWYYVEAVSGRLFLKSDSGTRARRWLYNGLHSFDFQMLLNRPWAWYLTIWAVSLCGLALSVTSAVIAWQWLRTKARRSRRRRVLLSSSSPGNPSRCPSTTSS